MNVLVQRTQEKYRNARERANNSITDIQLMLKDLAWEGLIWCIQDMYDLTEAEGILIRHYLYEHREKQAYDFSA